MTAVTTVPSSPRLPREVEETGRAGAVVRALAARVLHLGPAGPLPLVALGPALVQALRHARAQGRLAPGLEPAEASLGQEQAGLAAVDARAGRRRSPRISRLALIARDGTDRFQRRIARLAERHADRLLVVVLDAGGPELGGLLFGRAKQTRLLLVSHKRAVAEVLLALAQDAAGDPGAL